MNAPFYKFDMFGEEFSLIVAFVIGIGFGFFLDAPVSAADENWLRNFIFMI